mmetsp:Transcript_24095/g.75836  ORF Transcript_24095/g.75836 Transcript_24095/m.75836 type:complete len:294 (+) Transcript_24095:374-1255(+)
MLPSVYLCGAALSAMSFSVRAQHADHAAAAGELAHAEVAKRLDAGRHALADRGHSHHVEQREWAGAVLVKQLHDGGDALPRRAVDAEHGHAEDAALLAARGLIEEPVRVALVRVGLHDHGERRERLAHLLRGREIRVLADLGRQPHAQRLFRRLEQQLLAARVHHPEQASLALDDALKLLGQVIREAAEGLLALIDGVVGLLGLARRLLIGANDVELLAHGAAGVAALLEAEGLHVIVVVEEIVVADDARPGALVAVVVLVLLIEGRGAPRQPSVADALTALRRKVAHRGAPP